MPDDHPAAVPGAIRVAVEVVLLSHHADRLRYRVRRRPAGPAGPGGGWHPDDDARAIAGPGTALLHSTSWRYDDGVLVLTYVALPDPEPGRPTRPVPDDSVAISDDPVAPTADDIGADEVAGHACRHLALIARTDPVVAAALGDLPAYRGSLRRFDPGVAGGLAPPAVAPEP